MTRTNRFAAAAGLALAAATAIAAAQAVPQGSTPPPAPNSPPSFSVAGTVDGYELDPQGRVDAIVLKDGDRIMQLNVAAEWSGVMVAAAPVGQREQATGTPIVVAGNRAVYQLVSLTGPDGKQLAIPDASATHAVHVEGTVRSLNYAQRGEVDGAVLDTGDYVHVGKRAAAAVGLGVGLKLVVDGTGQPMVAGHAAIDAAKVNGVTVIVGPTAAPAAGRPAPTRGRSSHAGPDDRSGGRPSGDPRGGRPDDGGESHRHGGW